MKWKLPALVGFWAKRWRLWPWTKVNRGRESWPSPVAGMALDRLHTAHCYCCLDLKPEIVDIAGAGDVSVGAFLSQLFSHKPQPNNASVLSTVQQASSMTDYVFPEKPGCRWWMNRNPRQGNTDSAVTASWQLPQSGRRTWSAIVPLRDSVLSSGRRTAPRTFSLSKTHKDRFISSLLVSVGHITFQ